MCFAGQLGVVRSVACSVLDIFKAHGLRMSTGKRLWLPKSDHWAGACNRRKKENSETSNLPKPSCNFWSTLKCQGKAALLPSLDRFLKLLLDFLKSLLSRIFRRAKKNKKQSEREIAEHQSEVRVFAVINRRTQQWNVCHSCGVFPWRSGYAEWNGVCPY